MAIVVEDGTALAAAESYVSVAEADSRMSVRGFALWASMSTTEKEQALRRATDYMTQVYRNRWAGSRNGVVQALDWPRTFVPRRDVLGGYNGAPSYYLNNVIPIEVKTACVDLAYKAAAGDLSPDLQTQVTSESVGPISVSYKVGGREFPKYRNIDNTLAPLLRDGGSGSMMVLVRS